MSNSMETAFVVAMDGGGRTTMPGSIQRLKDVAVLRGGQVTVGLGDSRIKAWDRRDQEPTRTFAEGATCAAYSEFGFQTLTGHLDGKVVLWDTYTGKQKYEVVQLPAAVTAVAMTAGGELGAAVCGNRRCEFQLTLGVPGLGGGTIPPPIRHFDLRDASKWYFDAIASAPSPTRHPAELLGTMPDSLRFDPTGSTC
jgi:WD40 repeat protein